MEKGGREVVLSVHLYGVHNPAGHPGQPARHLCHALPHALLHVIHVRGLKVLVALALSNVAAPGPGVPVEVHVGADAVAALEPGEVCVPLTGALPAEVHVRGDGLGVTELVDGVCTTAGAARDGSRRSLGSGRQDRL